MYKLMVLVAHLWIFLNDGGLQKKIASLVDYTYLSTYSRLYGDPLISFLITYA